ncbi:MAG: PQQ-binding-like beta-propeller repeat protein [Holophagales bacterium]|nr:PQQ-binding-like beta-propeller repeat protein [Holophagales bacterium]
MTARIRRLPQSRRPGPYRSGVPGALTGHRRGTPVALLTVLALGASAAPATTAGADGRATWPGFRGPESPIAGVLPGTFGLTLAWKRDLGSGYSSLAIADGKVVALFTDGENDVVGAFDAASGEPVWKRVIDSKYPGHDGSDDGPLSTPTIADGTVYALGPKGQFLALALADGEELWRVRLDESNSSTPYYGYTSSPKVIGDAVILLTGGERGTITAFERATGDRIWSKGSDSVTYQSPSLMNLAGRTHLVAASDFLLHGLDPSNGGVLWSFRHTEEGGSSEGSVHPTHLGGDRLLLTQGREAVALEVSASGDGFEVAEVWRERVLTRTSALPVVHGGHIYGFTGRILSAVNAADGQIAWRSRGVSGQSFSLIDGHLAVLSGEGELVLVAADPAGYAEKARVKVFEVGDYADPAYYGGHIYVRNLARLAAVKVDPDAAAPTARKEEERHGHDLGTLGAFVKRLEAMPEEDRQGHVDAYFAEVESLPIREDNGIVHFVYRGAAEDVAVSGTFLGLGGEEETLYRVAGTDLFYRSFELDPRGNYAYTLSVDYSQGEPDPANPLQLQGRRGTQSELAMPAWRGNAALAEPAEGSPRGTLDTFQFRSEQLDNTREIRVWMPPGYGRSDAEYPVLVVQHGDDFVRSALLPNVLDNLVNDTVEPILAVFVPRLQAAEYNGALAGAYVGFLAEELLPHVGRHYRAKAGAEHRAAMGIGSGAVVSLHAALTRPEAFSKAALQSFYLTDDNRESYWQMVEASKARPSLVWVGTGPNDYDLPREGIDAEKSSRELVKRLEAGGLAVESVEVYGTAGWNAWRGETDRILRSLFPKSP